MKWGALSWLILKFVCLVKSFLSLVLRFKKVLRKKHFRRKCANFFELFYLAPGQPIAPLEAATCVNRP